MGHEGESNFKFPENVKVKIFKNGKFPENVKVKIFKNGKYISHVLPNEKVIVSISVKYYQKMLANLSEPAVSNDPLALINVKKD